MDKAIAMERAIGVANIRWRWRASAAPHGCSMRVSVSIPLSLSLHSLVCIVVFERVSLRQNSQRLDMTGVLFSCMQTLECFYSCMQR